MCAGVTMPPGKSWNFIVKFPTPGKSWKMILVLESLGVFRDADAKIFARLLIFMIRSYSDKTFFFATSDSDEHCSMDATVALLYVQ